MTLSKFKLREHWERQGVLAHTGLGMDGMGLSTRSAGSRLGWRSHPAGLNKATGVVSRGHLEMHIRFHLVASMTSSLTLSKRFSHSC